MLTGARCTIRSIMLRVRYYCATFGLPPPFCGYRCLPSSCTDDHTVSFCYVKRSALLVFSIRLDLKSHIIASQSLFVLPCVGCLFAIGSNSWLFLFCRQKRWWHRATPSRTISAVSTSRPSPCPRMLVDLVQIRPFNILMLIVLSLSNHRFISYYQENML